MPCRTFQGHGFSGVICGGRARPKKCVHCGRDADALCDWPTGGGKTCDKPCCSKCRMHVGPNVDYCKDHWTILPSGQMQLTEKLKL